MEKWADYCIYAVRYDPKHMHIDSIKAYVDKGDEFVDSKIYGKDTIVRAILTGTSFITIFKGADGKLRKGQPVRVITVDKVNYLKPPIMESPPTIWTISLNFKA